MSSQNLRKLIKLIVEEVLGEPDLSSEDERSSDDKKEKEVEEQNTVASVGSMGPNMPLGVGPSYPNPEVGSSKKKRKKKKKS